MLYSLIRRICHPEKNMLKMIATLPAKSNGRLETGVVAYEVPQHLHDERLCVETGKLVPESDIDLMSFDFFGTYQCCGGTTFSATIANPGDAVPEFNYRKYQQTLH